MKKNKMSNNFQPYSLEQEAELSTLLDYEMFSSIWLPYIDYICMKEWLQLLIQRYFTWKVRSKYARYLKNIT